MVLAISKTLPVAKLIRAAPQIWSWIVLLGKHTITTASQPKSSGNGTDTRSLESKMANFTSAVKAGLVSAVRAGLSFERLINGVLLLSTVREAPEKARHTQ